MSGQSPVEAGQVIAGKYRVERVLGQGGMGVVVVAMHDELDQRVAIKFLLQNAVTDAEWVARFSREAKAAARIKSEHAVKVYDVGKLETGAPYMVMEYLEGRDLQTILNDRRRIAVDEAVEYLLQACEAIAEAHSAGIVHRDLKPANLFVTHRTDGSPCVKILDFGISKMTSLTGTDSQNVTNTTAIVGSPLYMSPEQMRASKNVDRRTDIWSLGVILQELVSGEPSFVANTTAELCAIVLTAPPSPLQLDGAPPNVARGIAAVVEKCLKKAPEERYGTIAELARALEPFGPPSVKTSVERIVRLATGQRSPQVSLPNAEAAREMSGPVSIVPAGQQAASSLGQTELSAQPPAPVEAPAPAPVGAGTNAAWSSREGSAGKPKMSQLKFVVAVSIVAAIGVLSIVFAVARSSSSSNATTDPSQKPSANAAQTATAPTQTATQQTTAPIETQLPTATQGAPTVTATATATTHATAHTTATSTVKPPASGSGKRNPTAPVDTSGFGGRN